jgi:hypothetical protein
MHFDGEYRSKQAAKPAPPKKPPQTQNQYQNNRPYPIPQKPKTAPAKSTNLIQPKPKPAQPPNSMFLEGYRGIEAGRGTQGRRKIEEVHKWDNNLTTR